MARRRSQAITNDTAYDGMSCSHVVSHTYNATDISM